MTRKSTAKGSTAISAGRRNCGFADHLALGWLSALCLAAVLAAPASATPVVLRGSFSGSDTPAGNFFGGVDRVAVDEASGDVYVISKGLFQFPPTAQNASVIDKFDKDGTFLGELNSANNGNLGFGFFNPYFPDGDLAVDNTSGPNQGTLYIVDQYRGEFYAYDSSGALLWEHQQIGSGGAYCGVAVDPSGNPWVYRDADDQSFAQELNPADGSFTGATAELTQGIANKCHIAFDSTGKLYFGQPTTNSELGADVATDSSDNVYYANGTQGVSEYDSSGSLVTTFGAGVIGNALGVAVNSKNHLIYVSDSSTNTVQIWGPPVHSLITNTVGPGSGAIKCDTGSGAEACADSYDGGTNLTLTATPGAHSNFAGWSGGGCSGTGPCTITNLNADTRVTALFSKVQHSVTVDPSGSGSGSVSASVGAIAGCSVGGGVCADSYSDGTNLTLTATPGAHSSFAGWSGGGCSGTGPCVITGLSADTQVSATFAQDVPTITTASGATDIAQHRATVAGTVNPNGSSVSNCHIDYGTSTAYGLTAPCSPAGPGAGLGPVSVSAALSSLTAGATYHFRLVATNGGGSASGPDQTFATPADTCQTDPSMASCQTPPPGALKCKKGFVKKTVAGKPKCVKKKRHRR